MKKNILFQIPIVNKAGIINKEIYLFLYSLLKNIFIENNNVKLKEHLEKWKINININFIKKKRKFSKS